MSGRITVAEVREKGLSLSSGGPTRGEIIEELLSALLSHLDAHAPPVPHSWEDHKAWYNDGYDAAVMTMIDFRDECRRVFGR